MWRFNPFQGIWEFRRLMAAMMRAAVGVFQSLPGNLGVPAMGLLRWMEHGMSVSIPSREFGSSGFCKVLPSLRVCLVSIPSREFGSSGKLIKCLCVCCDVLSFNPFQGIWEFRLLPIPSRTDPFIEFQSLPGNLGVPARIRADRPF